VVTPTNWKHVCAAIAAGLTFAIIAPAAVSEAVVADQTRHHLPVLGYQHFEYGGRGYGAARPRVIFNGGDPAGLVNHIRWHGWGSTTAYGSGQTYAFKPRGGYYRSEVHMRLRASDLGICRGKWAYRRLYYRLQTKPNGKIQQRWHPWTRRDGNICAPPNA
jgi:hypothetical protein